MDCYVTYFIGGFIAFNADEEVIKIKPFPNDKIVSKIISLENKKVVSEEIEIIEELEKNFDRIIIESNKKTSDYNRFENVEIQTPNLGGEVLRENLDKYLSEFDLSKEEFVENYRKISLYKMKELSKSEDKHLRISQTSRIEQSPLFRTLSLSISPMTFFLIRVEHRYELFFLLLS